MTIRFDFAQDFHGFIFPPQHEDQCGLLGNGNRTLLMNIPFGKGAESCGVFMSGKDQWVTINVRYNTTSKVSSQESYLLHCVEDNRRREFENLSGSQVHIAVLLDSKPATEATVGQKYALRVQAPYEYRLTTCMAHIGEMNNVYANVFEGSSETPSNSSLVRFHKQDDSDIVSSSFMMFRFEESHRLYLQCAVTVCRGLGGDPHNRSVTQQVFHPFSGQVNNSVLITSTSVLVKDIADGKALPSFVLCVEISNVRLLLLAMLLSALVTSVIALVLLTVYNVPWMQQMDSGQTKTASMFGTSGIGRSETRTTTTTTRDTSNPKVSYNLPQRQELAVAGKLSTATSRDNRVTLNTSVPIFALAAEGISCGSQCPSATSTIDVDNDLKPPSFSPTFYTSVLDMFYDAWRASRSSRLKKNFYRLYSGLNETRPSGCHQWSMIENPYEIPNSVLKMLRQACINEDNCTSTVSGET
ncbi:unnamed protein product [Soboliphyme baturini]|uniref:ZP domain-containing protein n=1 Tax=Soboliphyme baturini TaxID=241478 RepID=A0A183IRL3_9BILA|nr:unnamed protein product [Soboliphyme baturini]